MDFLNGQHIVYTSKKYESVYKFFKERLDIKYPQLFILCASIGFKNNRKSKVEEKSRELRTNYFDSDQAATAYSIILGDTTLGKQINKFEDSSYTLEARKALEEYAEGGMDILIEKVFKKKWDGTKLAENYSEYDVDLISYIYGESIVDPF